MRSRSRVLANAIVVAALSFFLAAGAARAECDIDNAIFEDEFEFLDVSWGEEDDSLYLEDEALIIAGTRLQVNFSTVNKGANVCVDATILKAGAVESSPMGLIFWWQDWDNYYYMLYWADGAMEIRQMVNGNTTSLFDTDSLAIKKGVGQTNQIELRLRARDATVSFNGTEVRRFKGRQPRDGGVVGFIALSPDDNKGIFEYDNFVVSPLTE